MLAVRRFVLQNTNMTEFNRGVEAVTEASVSISGATDALSDLPVSMQLEAAIPSQCEGCDTAYSVCSKFARLVIKDQLSLEAAGNAVNSELGVYCWGIIVRPGGWGAQSKECRYAEPQIDQPS